LVAPRELIPQHKLLSDNEAKRVSKEYGISFEKFPKILESDQQAQKLGAKIGQLIEIDRQESSHKYKYYRYVVKG
jgi:DNA-directed RNA polymerase subunit H